MITRRDALKLMLALPAALALPGPADDACALESMPPTPVYRCRKRPTAVYDGLRRLRSSHKAPPPPGSWCHLGGGRFQLGAPPLGLVTVDV